MTLWGKTRQCESWREPHSAYQLKPCCVHPATAVIAHAVCAYQPKGSTWNTRPFMHKMNEGFTPSDWLSRLLTDWPTRLPAWSYQLLSPTLCSGISAWFAAIWRFLSVGRWQMRSKVSGQGSPLWPDVSDSVSGGARIGRCTVHGSTSGARKLRAGGERVTWIIQLQHRRRDRLLPPPCSVAVCQRKRDVKTSFTAAH